MYIRGHKKDKIQLIKKIAYLKPTCEFDAEQQEKMKAYLEELKKTLS